MKRSEINAIIEEGIAFLNQMNFLLPPFAYFSLDEWKEKKESAKEIMELSLGWDITDFGSGNFKKSGLLLFTIRNGQVNSTVYPKPYAEKIMIVEENQVTPMHFHFYKMEDIINRGGGNLVIELCNSTVEEKLADTRVKVSVDGMQKNVAPGEKIMLYPGESICLPPHLYHKFYGQGGKVLTGEVSMVNDDAHDNRFFEPMGRFPEIEEDAFPRYLLCNDYYKLIG